MPARIVDDSFARGPRKPPPERFCVVTGAPAHVTAPMRPTRQSRASGSSPSYVPARPRPKLQEGLTAALRQRDRGQDIAQVEAFASAQLDLALGRSNVIHAAPLAGPESETFLARSRAVNGSAPRVFRIGAR